MLCKDGVLLCAEKKSQSKLIERMGFDKIVEIDRHIYCLVSGLISDSQSLIENARAEAHYHRFIYKEGITVKAITQSVADLALNFGEGDITSKKKPIARPYGVSLLFAGVDVTGPTMYLSDPSGTMVGYTAKGLGSAEEGIESLLEKHFKPEMGIAEAQQLALRIMKQVMEEKIRSDNIDLFVLTKDSNGFVRIDAKHIEEAIKALPELI